MFLYGFCFVAGDKRAGKKTQGPGANREGEQKTGRQKASWCVVESSPGVAENDGAV